MRTLIFCVLVFISGINISFADSQKPSIVKNVSASAISETNIRLSWSKPWDNVEVIGYNLYRNDSYFTTLYEATNYIDKEVSKNNEYQYHVVAFDEARNFSERSEKVRVSTGSGSSSPSDPNPTEPPAPEQPQAPSGSGKAQAPTGVQAQAQDSSSIRLTWQQPSGFVEGYNLYKNDQYFTTLRGQTNYIDAGLSSGNTYRYHVVAFGNGHYSTKSAEVSATPGGGSSPAPSPPPPDTAPSPPPPQAGGVPSGYSLVFSDDFNAGSIDSSKWNTSYLWGADWIINNEQQYYVDFLNDRNFGHSPFYLADGKLNISVIKTPDHLLGKAKNQRYLSGAMTTHDKFKMKYGYVEMRAKLPRGKGLWPAFWLLHGRNSASRPEIDVMELLGDNTKLVYQTYHYYEDWNLRSTPSFQASGPDYASDFHTFGMKWEPGRIVWYVDGKETNRYESSKVSNEDMYILMNVAVGGSWAGSPDGSTNFPATFTIDYVRAYKGP